MNSLRLWNSLFDVKGNTARSKSKPHWAKHNKPQCYRCPEEPLNLGAKNIKNNKTFRTFEQSKKIICKLNTPYI